MKRITQDICERDSHYCFEIIEGNNYKTTGEYTREEAIDKLGKLEDIEEELGIDLITLFKAISQGCIFVREHNTEEKEIVAEEIKPNFLTHTFDFKEPRKEIGKGRPFSRIGKTYALTREELE